jgi:hypothetical protein
MNINFNLSKKYNHFFFVQTLADWHFSCRQEYIEQWLEETGPLGEEEKQALAAFRETISKYGFDEIPGSKAANGFDFFMRYDEFEDKSSFSDAELDTYNVAMNVLAPRFERIWQTEGDKLSSLKTLITDKYSQTQVGIADDLKTIFSDKIEIDRNIEVILLISTGEGGAGGANNGPDIITLECSSTDENDVDHLLSTIWHEATHLLLEKYIEDMALIMNKDELIKEASKKAVEFDYNYCQELLVFSLFSPISLLVLKYFPTEVGEKLEDSVVENDSAWLLEAKYIYIMYLVYLNGQFVKKSIDEKRIISEQDMAEAMIENHRIVKKFFEDNNTEIEWFQY